MEKTKFHSWKNGKLCKGCRLCVEGEKLVLFITGICPRNCWYCSLSEKKKNKDVIYANERPISNVNEAVEEARLCDAKGAGITGGDPLSKLDRTIEYIKKLKLEFGKDFHIHLYTSLDLVDENKLESLFNAGLDEIRFHPDIEDDRYWGRLNLAKKFRWKVGVEIPVIPGFKEKTIKLIEFVKDKIDFLNLNELEFSELNYGEYEKRGLKTKNGLSYGIKGSEELALELLEMFPSLNIHYCTSKLKDSVQLAKRIKKRAKNIKEKFDIVTDEGMLIRGAIYLDKDIKRKFRLSDLQEAKKKINLNEIKIDERKSRLLLSKKNVIKFSNKIKSLGYIPAVVEEYPTWDSLEIDVNLI
jgi:pyruvate formate-lyase activating enzyme-like uncharacterized protein